MEFESPDVERDFPGLYASESGKKSNESDFSDETHERTSKKDLLIGKRKDKKDSKKDRGYATLEGESSPEEDTDIKSPSKSKKSKPFKFPSKKEKREKSREKDVKEKEVEKDKEKRKSEDKDKEKKKEGKVKLKLKERKKSKHEDVADVGELPVFGVPLSLAVERSKCHDGVDIPLVVRDCIDHVQQIGLTAENVYKISGIKSRVQHVRRLYNQREAVHISDYDLPIATSLLKQFLRELPEPILTTELLTRFEEAGAIKDVAIRGAHFKALIDKLPSSNRTLLAWLLKHFDSITDHEKQNKMNAQSIATAMSPVLQTSERLLTALLCHTSAIFSNVKLSRYIPPMTSLSPALLDSCEAISQELRKQESLLGQIHYEMTQGRVSKTREEQLWEVQRIITQLKRKLRLLERGNGCCQRSLDECEVSLRSEDDLDLSLNTKHSPVPNNTPALNNITPALNNITPALNNITPILNNITPALNNITPALNHITPALNNMTPALNNITPALNNTSAVQLPSTPTAVAPQPSIAVVMPSVVVGSTVVQQQPPTTIVVPTVPTHATNSNNQVIASSLPTTVVQIDPTSQLISNHIKHTVGPLRLNLSDVISGLTQVTAESLEVEDINRASLEVYENRQKAVIETEELTSVIRKLKLMCQQEKHSIQLLRSRINQIGGIPSNRCLSDSSEEDCKQNNLNKIGPWEKKDALKEETFLLNKAKALLLEKICKECDACIDLRVQIKLLQVNKNH